MSKETIFPLVIGSVGVAVALGSLPFVKTMFDMFYHYYLPFVLGLSLFGYAIIRGARGK